MDSSSKRKSRVRTAYMYIRFAGAIAGIVGFGFGVNRWRVRSFHHAVEVARKSLARGCSFSQVPSSHISQNMGYVQRPVQDHVDNLYEHSFGSVASRPVILFAPSGTGKSEYNKMKLEEERQTYYLNFMCSKSPYGGLNEKILGHALGIHHTQVENSFSIFEKALSTIKDDQKSPRCLIILDDYTVTEDNVGEIQMLNKFNEDGLCDLLFIQSNEKDVRNISKVKSSRFVRSEYLPPTMDSFLKEIKKGDSPIFSNQEEEFTKIMELVGSNFSDLETGLEFYIQCGHSIDSTTFKLEEWFNKRVTDSIKDGMCEGIPKDSLLSALGDVLDEEDVTITDATLHLLDEGIVRTDDDGNIKASSKGIEIGVASFLEFSLL